MISDKEPNELKASLTHLKQEAIRFGATDDATDYSVSWQTSLRAAI
jgi:hypothetical protein